VQTLQRFASAIAAWARTGKITRLHVIGPRDERLAVDESAILTGAGVSEITTVHGALSATQVSDLLHRSQFALTNVTDETWSKSGVFMACAAHRCAVVADISSTTAPLQFVVRPDQVATIDDAELARRTSALREWYSANAGWPVVAARFAAFFANEQKDAA
jgi:hypothetical protein